MKLCNIFLFFVKIVIRLTLSILLYLLVFRQVVFYDVAKLKSSFKKKLLQMQNSRTEHDCVSIFRTRSYPHGSHFLGGRIFRCLIKIQKGCHPVFRRAACYASYLIHTNFNFFCYVMASACAFTLPSHKWYRSMDHRPNHLRRWHHI